MPKEKFCFLPGFKKDKLPAPGHAGCLARVTDDGCGIWMDQGEQWFASSGNAIHINPNAGDFAGWVCVAGGNPGSWKRFDAVEA